MIGRNDFCWCGSKLKWKKCHYPHTGPLKKSEVLSLKELYFKKYGILLKDEQEIEKIRTACRLASEILDATCRLVKEGVTTEELNRFAHQMHLEAGAIPAPLHYGQPPFPKSICTSLNEVICHGIPDNVPLREGDILNVDVTSILNGYYGDCSRMVTVGKVSPEARLVIDTSYECLMQSIAILKPGLALCEIGNKIQEVADARKCTVVYQFVGHGVGKEFHEAPQVPHYRNSLSIPLVAGMTFTIEPMINAGSPDAVIDKKNKWTARTVDGKLSAQWEHTILITEDGHEILTTWKREY